MTLLAKNRHFTHNAGSECKRLFSTPTSVLLVLRTQRLGARRGFVHVLHERLGTGLDSLLGLVLQDDHVGAHRGAHKCKHFAVGRPG
jgi:hypothetical protein